jgi:hypothetical protein
MPSFYVNMQDESTCSEPGWGRVCGGDAVVESKKKHGTRPWRDEAEWQAWVSSDIRGQMAGTRIAFAPGWHLQKEGRELAFVVLTWATGQDLSCYFVRTYRGTEVRPLQIELLLFRDMLFRDSCLRVSGRGGGFVVLRQTSRSPPTR